VESVLEAESSSKNKVATERGADAQIDQLGDDTAALAK